jgi:TonB family protein
VLNTLQPHAAQIYQIYMRELGATPGLRGKIVVEFTIAPNGKVVRAQTISSELHRPAFEVQILSTIRGIDFGVEDVKPLVATYPIDFAPR